MDTAIKDDLKDLESLISPDSEGVKVVYMSCTGPETICYSREELRNFKNQDAYLAAMNELRDWLRKHAGNADLADLHEAISAVVAQKNM